MSESAYYATVVEVFPMRLGAEVLLDVTLAPEDDAFPDPKPEDRLVLAGEGASAELTIWAAPRIPHGKGPRRVNVQFPRSAPGVELLGEGARVRLLPAG
jgi:hypothetical protein